MPAPQITPINPSSGPTTGGTNVALTGVNFQAGAQVTIDGIDVVETVAPTLITFTTPAHAAGAVDVRVTNPDGQFATLVAGFVFVAPPAPVINAPLVPAQGTIVGGTPVTVNGANFQNGATVTFGTVTVPANVINANQLTCLAPANPAGAVDVRVTNLDGQFGTLIAGFVYTAPLPPQITPPLNPPQGPAAGGTMVTINGANFQNGATVTFGAMSVPATFINAGQLTCITPMNPAGAADVKVTNPDGQSATQVAGFIFTAPLPPQITPPLIPSQGPAAGGTMVTINGANFQPGATVSFGGATTLATFVNANQLTCLSPVHPAGPVDVSVTNPDGQSATLVTGYIYTAPPAPLIIPPVVPAQGPTAGGTTVTINGANFQLGATVTFGATTVLAAFVNAGQVTCLTPANAAGVVDVKVTNPDGQSATQIGGFILNAPLPPQITPPLNPPQGPAAGGTVVIIHGANFQPGATVTFGTITVAPTANTPNQLTCTAPAQGAGAVDVTVTNPDGQTATVILGYIYN